MKAIAYSRYGGPEVLESIELADPVPRPDELVIAVRATSVVPGDWKMRNGMLKDIFPAHFPVIPGRDGSGIVAALGAEVSDFDLGDEVVFMTDRVTSGSYVERIARPARHVVRKPASLSHVEAAAVNHAGMCAWLGLVEIARVQPGMKVLVLGGAGAIGSFAVQLAHHLGAAVAATCRARSLDYVRGLGAGVALAYDRGEVPGAGLRDYDVVFDLVGGKAHDEAYPALRRGGAMVYLIGLPFQDRSAEFGVSLTRIPLDERVEVLRAVMRLVATGAVKPQVERVFPFHEAAAAQRFLEDGHHVYGRVVLELAG